MGNHGGGRYEIQRYLCIRFSPDSRGMTRDYQAEANQNKDMEDNGWVAGKVAQWVVSIVGTSRLLKCYPGF